MYDSLIFIIGYAFDHYFLPGFFIGLIVYYVVDPAIDAIFHGSSRGSITITVTKLTAILILSFIAAASIDEIFRPLSWARTDQIRQVVDALLILGFSLIIAKYWKRIVEAFIEFFRKENSNGDST